MRTGVRLAVLSLILGAGSLAAAATVEVVFVDPHTYTDIGSSKWDDEANMRVLGNHLQALGQRWLPAGQQLKFEVLEVDMAGTVRPSRAGDADLRVITGEADYPRLRLRYALSENGVVQRSGDERIMDLNYARGLANRGDSRPLFYERRMLDAWFKARFVAAAD